MQLKRIPRQFLHIPSLINLTVRSFMDLKALVSSLNDFASLSLAESWDNVGLLVEPSPPHSVRTLFLTNDLTEEVMEEALQKKADLILSYHPPIFQPLKRITWKTWKERLVIRALENRIGIYSPHTAYDAVPHGVNNWLAKGLGACRSAPLRPATASSYPTGGSFRVEFSACPDDNLLSSLRGVPEVSLITTVPARVEGEEQTRVSVNCTQQALPQVVALLSQNSLLYQKTEIISLQKPLLEDTGMGRLCTLKEPVSISVLVERVKSHLRLSHIRLALGAGKSLGMVLVFPHMKKRWATDMHYLLPISGLLFFLQQEYVHSLQQRELVNSEVTVFLPTSERGQPMYPGHVSSLQLLGGKAGYKYYKTLLECQSWPIHNLNEAYVQVNV
ncbi:NIF3-like protein 1 isoform X1 [Zootoca vivipara]|uniref:NIF3-like protein 1 isoform X1 n=1 Tax=Zootoca vivipara TaxID=8524 RepID=UPI00293C0E39|nr:NIF3-like protein 1 isoform X1 [Zootoca vivipara]